MKGIIYATRENVSHFSESLRSSLLLVAIAAFRFPIALYTGVCSIERICQCDKKKGKKQAAQPAEETKKSDSLIPINIFAGTDVQVDYETDGKDPEVLPDDQYPDWLWHMLVVGR